MHDVIIIGGSSAGLSAALILGRSRRHVLVIDNGRPCNRFSHASHGFLTRDGVRPTDLLQIARDQLVPYETVTQQSATVTQVASVEGGFRVETAAGEVYSARKLLLATGLRDTLPALDGIESFFGTSVFHCPYCDGWEVRDQALVLYNDDAMAFHRAMMLHQWTDKLTLATGGAPVLSDEEQMRLQQRNIAIVETPAVRVEGRDGQVERLIFSDGSAIDCAAIFIHLTVSQSTPFAQDLGCVLTENGLVQVDAAAQTNIAGVYAAGDMANPIRSIAVAVAHGATAAYHINRTLVNEDS
ncbi:MAG: hypothetical protein GC204_18115 [Chloroflexi bacterium]|nr:hypothetical protein [Chloroflexota bacterium]